MTEDFCEHKRSGRQHKTAFGFEDNFGEGQKRHFLHSCYLTAFCRTVKILFCYYYLLYLALSTFYNVIIENKNTKNKCWCISVLTFLFLFLLIQTIVRILFGLNKLDHNIFKIKFIPNSFKSRVWNYVISSSLFNVKKLVALIRTGSKNTEKTAFKTTLKTSLNFAIYRIWDTYDNESETTLTKIVKRGDNKKIVFVLL